MSDGAVLIVDDDAELRASTADWLEVSGFHTQTASGFDDAVAKIAQDSPDVVLSDIRMPGKDGMALLAHVRAVAPQIPVVLLTAHGDISLAVEAMRQGAEDFLEKPYDAEHLVFVVERARNKSRDASELARLRQLVGEATGLEGRLIGASPQMSNLRQRIADVAAFDLDVLIVGETGAGKELVARALHELSPRARHPFVAINCAAIPEAMFESELFGHAKGAFTSAAGERQGRLEFAAGGTVFLDEVESLPVGMQAKLLRVVQERSLERLGENRSRDVDVRFLAATKVDLAEPTQSGNFRADLYFRLAGAEIHVPPLRERGDDAVLLFAHFARLAASRYQREVPEISARLRTDLVTRSWPGNVRELKALAERFALGLGDDAREQAPDQRKDGEADPPLAEQVQRFEAHVISEMLEQCGGNTADAAQRLGVPRRTLNEKIARLGLRGSDL